MVRIRLVNVTKRFGKVVAVDKLNLEVKDGEFFTLLGPSGCGKTTTLRLIAGFYKPDEGEIYFDERLMNDIPPYKRNIGMVFQNYALFPHMNVFDNVAYGLRLRKLPRREIERRVKQILDLLNLKGLEHRYPHQLSGGQQQRVALARALVIEPEVLLLDEPLSNLDAKLRVRTRVEIRRIQRMLKITTIYVTHDQEEALSISDRVAVMREGRIEQIGTPVEIYENPASPFVADFVGVSNMLKGVIRAKGDICVLEVEEVSLQVSPSMMIAPEAKVLAIIRPENIELSRVPPPKGTPNVLRGRVRMLEYLGSRIRYEVSLEEGITLRIEKPKVEGILREGEEVYLIIDPENIKLLPLRE